MQVPIQITFRNLDRTESAEAYARAQTAKLETFYDRITACRVMIEAPHRRGHKGKIYHARVDLSVPGEEIVAGRDPAEHGAHEDLHTALRDAFRAAQRRLQDYVRRRQPQAMKTHIGPAHGQIVRLLPDRDCGFLATADGQEIYFHRNSVADLAFDKLEIGSEVRFVETMGEQGPQASTVALVGRLGKHAF